MKVEVGQTVCVVITLNVRGDPRVSEETVTKVGKVWATLNSGKRFSLETGAIDGGKYSSPGIVYPSRKEWKDEYTLNEAWRQFRLDFQYMYSMPDVVTIERIQQARDLLGLKP